ncbi:diguanylate cyclase [Desulfovibrio desulfuricans]|uniref:GGDEF domain-containing protein n=1 Tax=Desulfovibrio desulfuricans TaxID=876 RepID=UPI0035B3494E
MESTNSSGRHNLGFADIVSFVSKHRHTLDLILDMVPIPLFVKDRSGRYIDCNKSFEKMLSVSRTEIVGKTVYDIWGKNEADVFFEQDEQLFNAGGLQVYETKITSSTGIINIVQFHKQVFWDVNGNIAGFLGAMFDITEKKKLENDLFQLATTDDLTGLQNRREGMVQLDFIHSECHNNKSPYCLALIDIDNFKLFNDQYGHANGDYVLKQFGQFLKRLLRNSDACFRYGGEEFVLILPNSTIEAGYSVTERLRCGWSSFPLTLPTGQSVQSSVSIGLAQFPEAGSCVEDIVQSSDKALYCAKNSGRNRTVCSRKTFANPVD